MHPLDLPCPNPDCGAKIGKSCRMTVPGIAQLDEPWAHYSRRREARLYNEAQKEDGCTNTTTTD